MTSESSETLEYKLVSKTLTIQAIEKEMDAAWAALKDPASRVHKAALVQNPALGSLPLRREEVLNVQKSGAGLTGIEIVVAIVGSQAATKVGKDVWTYVMLPWLRDKFGDKAIERKHKEGKKK